MVASVLDSQSGGLCGAWGGVKDLTGVVASMSRMSQKRLEVHPMSSFSKCNFSERFQWKRIW